MKPMKHQHSQHSKNVNMNDRMLNLWKKIQEKGHSSTKKNIGFVNTLDPRYDGPLKSFDANISDIIPLEKCRLSPEFNDVLYNKMAYDYFKYFLETKLISELLDLYSFGRGNLKEKMNPIIKWNNKEYVENGLNNSYNGVGHATFVNADAFSDIVSKLPEEIRNKFVSIFGKADEKVAGIDLSSLKSTLYDILVDYWNEFLRSEWYYRYQIDLLTSRSVTLGDILQHETTLSYFMQFLEIEGCHHVVEFWLAASNFQQLVQNALSNDETDFNQILNDAVSIYEKYLSLLATSPLGFNDNVRCAVEEAICDETKGPHPDSFELAINTVLAFLRKTYLIPFLSSQHYVHMLSDMIRNCATLSNNSPASSVSEYYVDKRSFVLKHDPDTIWRRRKQSGLSFGHIDQLGRFQRDIEPDPGRDNESKISRLMKKLMQRNATKVEEEMAWQVAEMVIKDITDLTMGSHLENYFEENCVCNK